MFIPTYDIFKGIYGAAGVKWVEGVEGLSAASERMREFAAHSPGPYFIYDASSHLIVASIDTRQTMADRHNQSAT